MKSWVLTASCVSLSCCLALGQQPLETLADEVDVYMEFDNAMWDVMWPVKTLVSDTFAKVGVNITWHAGLPPEDHQSDTSQTVFSIRWAERAPATAAADALAAARPFCSQGASITPYEDRLRQFLKRYRDTQNVVFAYVVAQELGHVMQGLERHSDAGILKAQWSYKDFYQMGSRSLAFTADDVQLIHNGLDARMSRRHSSTRLTARDNVASLAHN